MDKVIVGISGGVDSTYVVKLLLDKGYYVEGLSLKMNSNYDTDSILRVEKELGIKVNVLDVSKAFNDIVISEFVDCYSSGKTPSPCITCNSKVKIETLCKYAIENGFDYFCTGHYCRIGCEDGRYFVRAAKDLSKDQSYMLSTLTQEQLSKFIAPLGEEFKADIKEAAMNEHYTAANAKESQDLCFISDGKYYEFIEKKVGPCKSGNFVDQEGKILGKHNGIVHYTIGQRKGLNVSAGVPVYVSKIDVSKNTIELSDSPYMEGNTFTCEDVVFQKADPSQTKFEKVFVKTRYSSKSVECDASIECGKIVVTTAEKIKRVTPGQRAVFYDNECVLFSGMIL